MKTLSLKLDDQIFQETEEVIEALEKPRNRYINEAIKYYNRIQKRKLLSKQLAFESNLVSEESMKVLSEFDEIEENDY
jgi:metal-responsive CopG/Arc/MetJ family transcriptional regulator